MKNYGFLMLSFLTACQKIRHEVFLIPKNYIGHIVLIHDQPLGKPDSIRSDSVIYKIPASGVFVSNTSLHPVNLLHNKYYYYDSLNNQYPLSVFPAHQSGCQQSIYNDGLTGGFKDHLENRYWHYRIIVVGETNIAFEFEKFYDTSMVVKALRGK